MEKNRNKNTKDIVLNIFIRFFLITSRLFNHRKINFDKINKIIIPAYTGLGNFVLKTPMIRSLWENYPNAHITILAGSPFGAESVLEGSDWINDIKILKENTSIFKKIRFAFSLRKEKYDLIFLPFDSNPLFLRFQSIIANIPIRIGHNYLEIKGKDPWEKFLSHSIPLKAGRHEIDLNLDLLTPLGINNAKNKETYFFLPKNIDVKNIFPNGSLPKRYWCVQLGAANANISPKRWSSTKFASAIDVLIEKYNISVVALGDKFERQIFDKVQSLMKNELIDCVGKTTINEVAFLIKNSEFLLCHDSGLMHISVALKTPVVAIWGPTDYMKNGPIGSQHHIIRKKLDCSPCMYGFKLSEQDVVKNCKHRKCMDLISVDDVVDVVSKVLDKKKK